jgi:hypothetical protein
VAGGKSLLRLLIGNPGGRRGMRSQSEGSEEQGRGGEGTGEREGEGDGARQGGGQ